MNCSTPSPAPCRSRVRLLWAALAALLLCAAAESAASPPWREVDEGLWLGRFDAVPASDHGDSKVHILKIDPVRYQFTFSLASRTGRSLDTLAERCRKEGFLAGINAGMFGKDWKTHVGYLRHGDHVNNARRHPKYESVFVFDPKREELAPARIADLDVEELSRLKKDYGSLLQNLRLIKAPGLNRWSKKKARWSEAALGMDREGNILFIFCRSPYTMHEFNEILLGLPIGLVAAQHLEGGPPASFYLDHNGLTLDLIGSYETGSVENDDNTRASISPIVLGIVKREPDPAREPAKPAKPAK